MQEVRLSEIWIYPVKSLGGIRLQSAKVFEKGLEFDRRWMLVDETGHFMTQRTTPAMALFKLNIERDNLVVSHQGSQLSIALRETSTLYREVTIWNDTVQAAEVNSVASAWFSERLQTSCSLVFFPENHQRLIDAVYAVNQEQVSLADGYPFLIIGQASLDLLNSKLDHKLPMNRFRPNFVFTGGKAHEEDGWRNFTIGSNRFVGVKPCVRCALPTVNQETGEKGDEPLRTLATYRKSGNKIRFGQNLVALDHSTVSVGDLITVQSHVV